MILKMQHCEAISSPDKLEGAMNKSNVLVGILMGVLAGWEVGVNVSVGGIGVTVGIAA